MTENSQYTSTELGTDIQIPDILDAFEFLDDWEDRYAYIIDLGRKLPPFPDEERTEENFVHGCQSQVWVAHHRDSDSGKLFFVIDSDAMIVKGLAAIVLIALNARKPDELLAVDVDDVFKEIDLFRHISPTRGNGLRSMVAKIQGIASHA